jgi:hypothetical protein
LVNTVLFCRKLIKIVWHFTTIYKRWISKVTDLIYLISISNLNYILFELQCFWPSVQCLNYYALFELPWTVWTTMLLNYIVLELHYVWATLCLNYIVFELHCVWTTLCLNTLCLSYIWKYDLTTNMADAYSSYFWLAERCVFFWNCSAWLIVSCWMSSGKYFMNIQGEKKLSNI